MAKEGSLIMFSHEWCLSRIFWNAERISSLAEMEWIDIESSLSLAEWNRWNTFCKQGFIRAVSNLPGRNSKKQKRSGKAVTAFLKMKISLTKQWGVIYKYLHLPNRSTHTGEWVSSNIINPVFSALPDIFHFFHFPLGRSLTAVVFLYSQIILTNPLVCRKLSQHYNTLSGQCWKPFAICLI